MFLLILFGSAMAVRDPFLYHPDPDPVVEIHDTKNTTVNLTLSEFSAVAKPNREAYNSIVHLLRPNTTISEYNILLRGLEEARKRSELTTSAPVVVNSTSDLGSKTKSEESWESTIKGILHSQI